MKSKLNYLSGTSVEIPTINEETLNQFDISEN